MCSLTAIIAGILLVQYGICELVLPPPISFGASASWQVPFMVFLLTRSS